MTDVSDTLAEREKQYGSFAEQSMIAQLLKSVIHDSRNWDYLSDDKREALDMIAVKIARILNGNPLNHDSWIDIAGYAKLVADTLTADR